MEIQDRKPYYASTFSEGDIDGAYFDDFTAARAWVERAGEGVVQSVTTPVPGITVWQTIYSVPSEADLPVEDPPAVTWPTCWPCFLVAPAPDSDRQSQYYILAVDVDLEARSFDVVSEYDTPSLSTTIETVHALLKEQAGQPVPLGFWNQFVSVELDG